MRPPGLRYALPSHRRRWAPSAHNAADGMALPGAFLYPLTARQFRWITLAGSKEEGLRTLSCPMTNTITDDSVFLCLGMSSHRF